MITVVFALKLGSLREAFKKQKQKLTFSKLARTPPPQI